MSFRIQHLAVSTLLLLLSASVTADPLRIGFGKSGKFMAFFDTNNDEIVTMDEFNDAARNRFSMMDANGDNIVTREEFKTHVRQRRSDRGEKIYQRVDADGDGRISRDEFVEHKRKRAERRFQMMDKDNNGYVSSEEFRDGRTKRFERKFGRSKRVFKRIDTNGDGQVTRDESTTAWTNWFRRIDQNRDHVVTLDEVRTYRRDRMANW